MCFNASLAQSADKLKQLFHAGIDSSRLEQIYFMSAFTLPYWPVLKSEDHKNFQFLTWGLIPHWEKNMEAARNIRLKTLNARFETLHERVSYRDPADYKRCAVVVDGYFEWQELNGKKYPYYLSLPRKKPFLLAGLWDRWVNRVNGQTLETFSVVTTRARGIAEQIHNTKKRMPFILDESSAALWLDRHNVFADIQDRLTPSWEDLRAHRVSNLLTSRTQKTNVPEVQEEIP